MVNFIGFSSDKWAMRGKPRRRKRMFRHRRRHLSLTGLYRIAFQGMNPGKTEIDELKEKAVFRAKNFY
jgi:hypothetical protein